MQLTVFIAYRGPRYPRNCRGGGTIPRAARSFAKAYEPKELWLVNMGFAAHERMGVTDVSWIAPTEIAARVREAFRESDTVGGNGP